MVTHLLESGTRRRRSAGGAIPSIVFHSVLILAAIHATAHAALQRFEPPRIVPIVLTEPDAPNRHVDARPQHHAPSPVARTAELPTIGEPSLRSLPQFPFATATAEENAAAVRVDDFGKGLGAGSGVSGESLDHASVHSSRQVDRQAEALPGTLAPTYPEALRASGAEGTVVARFVVDSVGRVEAGSFSAIGSVNPLFVAAVQSALSRARFRPAEAGGVPVRQFVEQSFTFTLR